MKLSRAQLLNVFGGHAHCSLGGTQMLNEKEFFAAIADIRKSEKPIDITEEEIIGVLTEYSNTDLQTILTMHGSCYVIDPMDYHKIVTSILSKLK